MATRVINRVALPAGPVTAPWPQGVTRITIALDDADWTQTGTEIELVVELSFDEAQTFPILLRSTMVVGAKTRFGDAPFVDIPRVWIVDGSPTAATHARARMARIAGTGNPRVGLIVGFDGDRTVS